MKNIFLPDIDLSSLMICDEYKDWLEKWLFELIENIEKELVIYQFFFHILKSSTIKWNLYTLSSIIEAL